MLFCLLSSPPPQVLAFWMLDEAAVLSARRRFPNPIVIDAQGIIVRSINEWYLLNNGAIVFPFLLPSFSESLSKTTAAICPV